MNSPFRARRHAAPSLAFGLLASAIATTLHAQTGEPVDEVVVTGLPRDRAAGELAQSITVVASDELERVRASNLGETLAGQLGVSSSYFGAGSSRPIIRGLAGARVRMLEDGIDTMDAATVSDDHAVTVEPLAADQIEIFRGPTTLLYGSGAIGGVVNTVTTRIPDGAPRTASKARQSCAATRRPTRVGSPCASTAVARASRGTSTQAGATARTTRYRDLLMPMWTPVPRTPTRRSECCRTAPPRASRPRSARRGSPPTGSSVSA